MKRRDFLKSTVIAGTILAVPLALTVSVSGNEWKEFYVCEYFDKPAFTAEVLAGAHRAFKRKMLDGDFTEIRGFRREINYDVQRQCWIHTVVAQLR